MDAVGSIQGVLLGPDVRKPLRIFAFWGQILENGFGWLQRSRRSSSGDGNAWTRDSKFSTVAGISSLVICFRI